MISTRVLLPEVLVAGGAVLTLLIPALAAPRSRPGIRRWLGWAAAGLALAALLLELWLGAAVGTLFGGGVLQDRFALFAKAAVLLGLLVAVTAADWEIEALPGPLPFAFLAALGGMTAASAATLPGLWAGAALGVVAAVAALSRRVRTEVALGAAEEAMARAEVARATVSAGALLLLLAVALAYLMATGGDSLAQLQGRLAGGTAVTVPTVLVALLAAGALAALLLMAPLRYGVAAGPLGSPLAAGVASGLGAAAAGIPLLKLAGAAAPSGIGWGPGLAAGAAAAAVVAGLGLAGPVRPRAALGRLGVTQLAWVLAGAAVHDADGVGAALFLLGAAVVALSAGPVLLAELEVGGTAELRGLAAAEPARAAALALAALSLAGLPPLAGFFGQFGVAVALAAGGVYWALALLVLAGLLAAAGVVRLVRAIFLETALEEARGGTAARTGRRGRARLLPSVAGAVLLAVLVCAYGLFANPISGLAWQGAAALGLR